MGFASDLALLVGRDRCDAGAFRVDGFYAAVVRVLGKPGWVSRRLQNPAVALEAFEIQLHPG